MRIKHLKIIYALIGAFYFPVFICFWLLHKVARFALAICCYGILEFQVGQNILKNLFKPYD